MANISVSLPTDGTTADVADYNTPITTIVNEFNGNIDNSNIKTGAAISGTKLADSAVTTAKVADSAVTTVKYANTSVTPDKLNLGTQTDAGTGSTTSTSFVNLSTRAFVTLTVPASGIVLLLISGHTYNSSNGAYSYQQINITGANTTTSALPEIRQSPNDNNQRLYMGGTKLLTGLTPGSTTFEVQVRVSAGTGTWEAVEITAIPLG